MILFAYDGGVSAKRAIAVAAVLLRGRRAHVIHVWELLPPPADAFSVVAARLGAAVEAAVDRQKREADATAQAGVALAREAGFTADGEAIRVDDVADALDDAVARLRPDLVVVGSHHRSGFKALLEGSVSRHVGARAHAPVLIVPLTPPATPG